MLNVKSQMSNAKRGFTLIELLVVIAIIGILSTLAIVALNTARGKAKDAKRVSDIKQLQTALEMVYNDNVSYALTDAGGAPCTAPKAVSDCINPVKTYLPGVERMDDPSNEATLCGNPAAAICNYAYNVTPGTSEYRVDFWLENRTGDLEKGAHFLTQEGIQTPTPAP